MKLAHISDLHLGKFFHDFNILEKGNIKIEKIPLVPKREVRQIKGLLKTLLKNFMAQNEEYNKESAELSRKYANLRPKLMTKFM